VLVQYSLRTLVGVRKWGRAEGRRRSAARVEDKGGGSTLIELSILNITVTTLVSKCYHLTRRQLASCLKNDVFLELHCRRATPLWSCNLCVYRQHMPQC